MRWQELQNAGVSSWALLVVAELLHGRLRGRNNSGLFFPCGPVILAKILKTSNRNVRKAYEELKSLDVLFYDDENGVTWFPELWRHDWISNADHGKGIAREIQNAPENVFWPSVFRTFSELQAAAKEEVDEETGNRRASWLQPILDAVQERMGDTCVQDMSKTHVGNTTLSPEPRALNPEPNNKGRIRKEEKPRMRLSVEEAFEHFLEAYKDATRKEHPGISKPEKERILGVFNEILEIFDEVIEPKPDVAIQKTTSQFFEDWKTKDLKADDPTVWLFIKPEVWRLRAYRAGVLDTESVFDCVSGSVLGEE
jgi:hypothetical protein